MKNKILEFFKFLINERKNGTLFIVVTFIFSIVMFLQFFLFNHPIAKFLSIVSSILFMASSFCTISYNFKFFKNKKIN